MRKNLLKITGLLSCAIITQNTINAQITFTNKNNLLHSETGVLGSNASVRSGNSVAIVDVNGDGLDDVVKLDQNRYVRIEYQQAGGTFTQQYIGDFVDEDGWAMCLADVDHNGYKDVLYCGWGTGVRLMKLDATGTGILGSIIYLPNGDIASQNANFMDVNNDGWEDIFVCNDVNESKIWVNDGFGNFPAEQNNSVINFDINAGTAAPNDESGNYGTVWTDFDNDGDVDFYIAHCRQAYGPGDIRRTNVLFENNGNGTYTSNAAAHGMASNDQDWTASFGDIDNDGDFDLFMTKHDVTSRYYINDGNGNFTISPNAIAFGSMPMQAQFEDFDNDGFVDLFITGDNDHRLYHNNGNSTFTNTTPVNLNAGSNLLSFASGDLNHDGKIDIYGSYGSTYNNPSNSIDDIYWQNSTSNSNHYLTLNLTSTISNAGSLGARAYIYGAWGVQTREVRAGESYGTLNSSQLHFGLGAETVIDSVVVNWPSGEQTVVVLPVADQFLNVIEQNSCTLSGATVNASGPLTFCTGQNVDLTANASGSGTGYTYLWSNGATTQTINVTNAGSYAVTITESVQCNATSSSMIVVVDPNETPGISALADTVFCAGDSIMLSSTSATSYLWSNGATTQSTYASQSGTYSVQTQGLCQQWNSNSISVNVHPAPAPVSSDVTLPAPSTTTLTATGNAVVWYADPTGGSALATGSTYNTPMITTDTVFYAEDSYNYGGGTVFGAPKYHFGASNYAGNTTNGYLIFTAHSNCTLKKVKVYTDTPGTRKVELRSSTGIVLQSQTVNIPIDTSFVTLNFTLTAGTAYQLGTNTAQNNTSFGFNSPRLKRVNNSGVAYPYNIILAADTLVSITGTSPTGTVFYYYFDWELETAPVVCTSPRTPVYVFVNPVGIKEVNGSNAISIYPNPASDFVNVVLKDVKDSQATVAIHDLLGKQVYSETYKATANMNKAISTSGLTKGAYEIGVSVDGKVYHSRIVIQ
ncbi:MAG: FG-GAP-like repeat-containing protein [Bacteroidota bacterium]|nr:FG-GAP-like repeat-containing protein [Bacteroidota bacterium]